MLVETARIMVKIKITLEDEQGKQLSQLESWDLKLGNQRFVRKYYELCALWQLRIALRSGNLWLSNSRMSSMRF